MSIQRYRTNHIDGDYYETPEGEFVTYADHVAEVERMRAACIAAVEEFFRMPIDEQITEWVDTYGEAEWFDQACLAALRKVQP
jgi:hypothetical protein